ncbi:MAG: hypothetical protein AB7H77_03990 [Bdellovibrionales bacterium]
MESFLFLLLQRNGDGWLAGSHGATLDRRQTNNPARFECHDAGVAEDARGNVSDIMAENWQPDRAARQYGIFIFDARILILCAGSSGQRMQGRL